MATSTSFSMPAAAEPSRRHPVSLLLRLEGLAAAVFSLALYARLGDNWILFAALWLVPDLSLLAYLRNAQFGARVYNAVHSYVTPATLGLVGFLLHGNLSMAVALIWANHIGVDRLLGYGLKHGESFSATHLGRVGRDKAPVQA